MLSVVAAILCSALDFVPSDQQPPIALSFLLAPGDCRLVLLLVQQCWAVYVSEAMYYWCFGDWLTLFT